LLASGNVAAQLQPLKFCIWDPVGTTGPFATFLKQTKLSAINWGIDLSLDIYTDEKVAAADFKSGLCDAVFLTNILAKDFIPFTAVFGSPGGVRNLEQVKVLAKSLSSPKVRELIQTDDYELAGLFPIGEIYFFLKDRSITKAAQMSGKKIIILNGDIPSTKFTEVIGGSPVHATLATWSGQFNNGNIDVMFAPTMAYNTFELYQGLGDKGGIVKYNLLYYCMNMLVNRKKVPEDFAPKMREHTLGRFNELEQIVKNADAEVPEKYWIELDQDTTKEYADMNKRVRLELRDEGKYDAKAVSMLYKIRCAVNKEERECFEKPE
jgi:hypothetical protein